MPPVIAGAFTLEIKERVESFFHSVAASSILGSTGANPITRAELIAGDVIAFTEFQKITWPRDAADLLRISILEVQAFKDHMGKHGGAPKTINRRISSLSSFYRFFERRAYWDFPYRLSSPRPEAKRESISANFSVATFAISIGAPLTCGQQRRLYAGAINTSCSSIQSERSPSPPISRLSHSPPP